MRFDSANNRGTGWLGAVLYGILQPGQSEVATGWRLGQLTRQGLAVVLSAVMILIPMGQADAFAQDAPPPTDQSAAPPPSAQPLTPDQLNQLVAPIALYPDNLVAQVLAASTYPTQVVEANRWLKEQGNAPASQIAAGANNQNWDASVKALTAFPQVLDQMDKNLQWTTDLGNAYYNQPQDVMGAVQAMRQRAQSAGNLRSNQQLSVDNSGGDIEIAPANPQVVYVPVYNPWVVYGAPIVAWPGFYWAAPPGIFFGGLAIGFGIGIGIGFWGGFGWGWGHWGMGWHGGYRGVMFNHGGYFTHSTTVINHGFNRPGGPGRGFGARGAYAARGGAGFNRGGAGFNRGTGASRGATRSGTGFAGRSGATAGRSSFGGAHSSVSHGATSGGHSFGGGHAAGGGGHFGGGHGGGGGHHK
ncbi:MAG: DUF3300 domain-containing protein [Candidatus Korobacteraceae bacterium]